MSGLTACGCASRSTRPSSAARGHGRAIRPGCPPSSHGEGEVSNVAPGFSEDPVIVVNDPFTFARWHPVLIDWAAALRAGTPQVSGPPEPCRTASLERRPAQQERNDLEALLRCHPGRGRPPEPADNFRSTVPSDQELRAPAQRLKSDIS